MLTAQAWLALDCESGDIIQAYRHTERRCIASLTKIATAAVVLACAKRVPGLLDSVATVSFEVRETAQYFVLDVDCYANNM